MQIAAEKGPLRPRSWTCGHVGAWVRAAPHDRARADQLAVERAGRLRAAELSVDENPQIATAFQHSKHPGALAFKDGREADRIIGAALKSGIARRLKRWVE